MKKCRTILCALIAVSMIFSISSCAAANGSAKKTTTTNKKLVIGLEADATTMLANTDMNSSTDVQVRNIYDPLIKRDAKTGEMKPWLATSWKAVDANTWEFALRKGVKFSNGDPFNAESVKYSIEYINDKANQSAYLTRWSAVKEIKIINDYDVQVITATPYPTFLHRIADDLLIMDPVSIKETGLQSASTKPVGTGPYVFKEWKRNQYLDLTANSNYWAGKPKISEVRFRYIPEFSSRLASFMNGEIDLFNNVPVDSVAQIKESSTSKIATVNSARVDYMAFNTFKSSSPVQNEKVRQAINYAVDVSSLLKNILNGYGVKITGPLATNNQDYTKTAGYTPDQEKAISLLKEAGCDPKTMTLTLDTSNGRYPMDKQVAQGIASQLAKIGIKVNVNVNEWSSYLAKIRQHTEGDMYIMGWGPSYEGQTTIQNLFTKNAPYSGFYDPETEGLIIAADKLTDSSARKNAFGTIQNMLVEKAAWVPLWQQVNIYAVNKKLNFTPRADETLQIYDMSWSNN